MTITRGQIAAIRDNEIARAREFESVGLAGDGAVHRQRAEVADLALVGLALRELGAEQVGLIIGQSESIALNPTLHSDEESDAHRKLAAALEVLR